MKNTDAKNTKREPAIPTPHLILGLALLCSGGCALPVKEDVPPAGQRIDVVPAGPRTQAEPVLYARDGSVVSGQPAGSVVVTDEPQREIAGSQGTRTYLLELYQSAIEERDNLALEVSGLTASLEKSEAHARELEQKVLELDGQLSERDERLEQQRLASLDLAGRLTTAQIRRLQAEKLLIEAKLDWRRTQAMIEGSATSVSPDDSSPATRGALPGGRE